MYFLQAKSQSYNYKRNLLGRNRTEPKRSSGRKSRLAVGVRGYLGEGGFRNSALRIRNPTNDRNPESKIPRQGILDPVLESGIYTVESRIQDCLGFPYKWRLVDFGNGREYLEKKKWENQIVSLAQYADSRL